MRFVLSILLLALVAGFAEWFAPWWTAAIVAFIIGLYQPTTGKAFLAGFCGIALLWLGFALWRDIPNEHILSTRMALLFKLPSFGLYLSVTAILGGLIGGLAAWSGAQLKRVNQVKQA
ncbi:MAG: hypothetical protein ABI378_01615 [Chitinophagaceae bacterium]